MKKNKEASITFRLTPQEKEVFMSAAEERDIPISQLIRVAVREYLKED